MNNTSNMITDNAHKRSRIIYIFEATFEYFVSIMMTGAFLSTLLSRNGIPDWLIGIISSFISLTCVFQIFSAAIVRKGSRIKSILFLFTLANELIFILLYVIPVFPIPTEAKGVIFALLIFSAYVIYNLAHPLKFSWYMFFVDAGERGTFTAKKEITSLVLGMAFSYLMGSLTDYFTEKGDDNTAFLLSAVTLFVVSCVHLLLILSTKGHLMQTENSGNAIRTFVSSFKSLANKTVFALVLLEVIWKCANGISVSFYGVYQINDMGFPLKLISIFTIIQAGARVCASPLMGRIADRFGWHTNLSICFMSACISFVAMTLCNRSNAILVVIIYNIFHGIAMSGINGGLMNIVFDYVPEKERTATLGIKSAIAGVVGFLSTTLGGIVLAKIQSRGGVVIFGYHLFAQQVLSFISVVLCVVLVLYVLMVVSKLKSKR